VKKATVGAIVLFVFVVPVVAWTTTSGAEQAIDMKVIPSIQAECDPKRTDDAQYIKQACDAYMTQAPAGCTTEALCTEEGFCATITSGECLLAATTISW